MDRSPAPAPPPVDDAVPTVSPSKAKCGARVTLYGRAFKCARDRGHRYEHEVSFRRGEIYVTWVDQKTPATKKREAQHDARAEDMKRRVEAGETLDAIGKAYGLTRERVRQIIRKNYGEIIHERIQRRVENRLRQIEEHRVGKQDARAARWGLTGEEYARIRTRYGRRSDPHSPFQAYVNQERNAHRRDIPWTLTFPEWWAIWERSGKWEERGRPPGYGLARVNYARGFTSDNVKVVPGAESSANWQNSVSREVRSKLHVTNHRNHLRDPLRALLVATLKEILAQKR